ncbi:hypothetical protein O3G_MSEX004650 [Manduca sexta]|uniref:Peptidase A2 domain-containing protein n=1 Tax=Manduca sexta TaxID=7130 RepID=A0A921YYE6_MANSE|nr:hypothetical protein O3G_MSEX004650 [Manduca sexta]
MNNLKNYNRLPYIYISELGGRLLIDTGASQSLISPKIIDRKKQIQCRIKNVLHYIKTAHGTSKHKQVAYIKLPEILFNQDITHKFLIFNFDPDFVGLLGLDLLVPLNSRIDIRKMILRTDHANIPIRDDIKTYSNISAKTEQVVNLLCNYNEGDYYLAEKNMKNGLIFPASVVSVKNGSILTTVINPTEKEIQFKNSCHLNLQHLDFSKNKEVKVSKIHKQTIADNKTDQILKNNLNRLRTDHMNPEENREIRKLCYNYRDIFHCEDIPLTFIHEIKHKLRFSDDKAIFVRNYRQAPKQKEEIKRQINKLLEQNIIRESNSP